MCKFYNKDKLINYLINETNTMMDKYCDLSNKHYKLIEDLRDIAKKYDNSYHNYMIPTDEVIDIIDEKDVE